MDKYQLRQYKELELEAWSIRELLTQADQDKYTQRAPALSDMPRAPRRSQSEVERRVLNCEAVHEMYDAKLKQLEEQLLAIESAIDSLPPKLRTILRVHYIKGYRWEDVCTQVGYCWQHVHRLHKQALIMLADK